MAPVPPPSWANTPTLIWQAFTYGYALNVDAAWAACGLYVAVGLLHAITTGTSPRARRVWWMWLPVLTAGMEAAGFATRVTSAQHVELTATGVHAPLGEVIASFVLLLVPPIILAVVNYELVGRVMRAANERVGCMTDRWITRTYLSLDVLCFLVQCGAAPLLIGDDPNGRDAGTKIVLTGLVLQFVVFLGFVLVSLLVLRKPSVRTGGTLVRRVVSVCLATIFTLLVRNGFRLYEYSAAYAWRQVHPMEVFERSEVEFYVLEFVPVWAVHVVFAVYNFGRVLPADAELAAMMAAGGGDAASGAATTAQPGAKAPNQLGGGATSEGDASVANPAAGAPGGVGAAAASAAAAGGVTLRALAATQGQSAAGTGAGEV